jgi:hypothetical protein
MRFSAAWVIAFFFAGLRLQAQNADSTTPVATYNLLRENDDWSFLADSTLRADFWDPLKYIPLGCDDCYLTIGGEVREAFEQVGNDNWGKQPYMNAFFLERYMLNSDWHLSKNFRVFVQLKSGLESFRQGGPRPIDEKNSISKPPFLRLAIRAKRTGPSCESGVRS